MLDRVGGTVGLDAKKRVWRSRGVGPQYREGGSWIDLAALLGDARKLNVSGHVGDRNEGGVAQDGVQEATCEERSTHVAIDGRGSAADDEPLSERGLHAL